MKQIILFVLLMYSITGLAQKSDTAGLSYFNKAMDYYQAGKSDSALFIWTNIVENKIGTHSDVYGNSFFNIPTIYWQIQNYSKAKEWFKRVLVSDLNDNDETGDLMEPHTNYKHKSAIALAGLDMLDSNLNEVLFWLYKADTTYRYWGFEGSATNISEEQARLLDWKTEMLIKLNRKNEAIREIITTLICADHLEDFFKKSKDKLMSLIGKDFKSAFDASISSVKVTTIDQSNWTANFSFRGLKYSIPITSVQHDKNIPHYWNELGVDSNKKVDAAFIISEIRHREFYSSL